MAIGAIPATKIFTEIKKCLSVNPKGFNLAISEDGEEKVGLVTPIPNSNESVYKKYSDYGVALLQSLPSTAAPRAAAEVSITEGLSVYYASFSEENEVIMCHKGRISSIKENEQEVKVFTIDGPQASHYRGSPVFTYDKVKQLLHLIGFISFKPKEGIHSIGEAIHIGIFNKVDPDREDVELGEERGGKRIKVSHEGFSGQEIGTGKGPRSILITGNAISVTYTISFINGDEELNPHHDQKYNNGGQPKLYQKALEVFVDSYRANNQQIQNQINFRCYKNSYIVKKSD